MRALLAALLIVPAAASAEESLCARLGGPGTVAAIMESFGDRMRTDDADKLGRFWLHRGTDGVERERRLAVAFVQNAAGCSIAYNGREMDRTHRGMGISARDWDRAMEYFRLAVWKHVDDPGLRVEIIALVSKTRGQIVDCEDRVYGCPR